MDIKSLEQVGEKTTLVGIWRDITERKQTEKALHALKIELEQRVEERTAQLRHEISQRQLLEREILEISGHERRRISHDLHDSVGQRLTGLKFLSSALSQRLARTKVRDASAAANISTELGKAIEEVRDIAYGLHPVQHNVESLMFSLQHLAENVTKTFKVPCHFECHQPVLFHDYSAATHLYRIAQEAAGNAARHAKAEDIRITLDQDDAFIHLRVIDNGRGLSSTTRRRKGLGMEIMKYRTSAIGATLDIINGKNGGTVVHCAYHTHTTAKEID